MGYIMDSLWIHMGLYLLIAIYIEFMWNLYGFNNAGVLKLGTKRPPIGKPHDWSMSVNFDVTHPYNPIWNDHIPHYFRINNHDPSSLTMIHHAITMIFPMIFPWVSHLSR